MSLRQNVRKEGTVREILPGPMFRVRLDEGQEVLAHLAGKLRVHFIKILTGDRVILELPDDKSHRGRIVYRK
ncbi:MAG: translation initiation factor IF-1 [Candidatus Terrybacteria bacterium RIFCSPHIGHO2_01_FULL_48_17]|uniref:Translation initiation factor IF-1 n=1 Tax=Candidatus Terrybacteria bacterium RIFCSPHIGHO2_01_FULL_48_17 TaxID=1802362 RepID=A0A1G2PHP6_9BACT|nr:MAG: translation initiation factor IF-1 [Candidatus Terrybacteria bacterium RIFCSPHIGHO2_01_FULL_48_17]OHA53543.1 MAG: translation initiation factor IF-1 [Candidatus Terrybacteria bacterium RIFCSPLOWO2_01_FULL_48_14]